MAIEGNAISEQPLQHGKPLTLAELLYRQLSRVKGPLAFIFLSEIGLMVPLLALVVFFEISVDRFLSANDYSWWGGFLMSIFVAIALIIAFAALQERIFINLKAKLSLSMNSQMLWHLLRMPIDFFAHRHPGEVAYRVSLIDPIASSLTGNLAKVILDVFLIAVYGIVMIYYSATIALIAVVAGLLSFFLLWRAFSASQSEMQSYAAEASQSSSYSLSLIDSIETVKSMGMERESFSYWAENHLRPIDTFQKVGKKALPLAIIFPLLYSLTLVATVCIAGMGVLKGHLTAGMFVALQLLLVNFMFPLLRLANFSQAIPLLKADLIRLNEVLCHPLSHEFRSHEETKDAAALKKLEGYIDIRNIKFGYDTKKPALIDGISMSLYPGKAVAIIGKTGSGKTTLAMLIAGLLHPWEGKVTFDSKAGEEISRLRVTSSLALIEQTPFIFRGSFRENIALMNPYINEDDLLKACKDACIHDDIISRVGGYDFEVADNGSNLSSGECQRLEIARGLLKEPSILILDECTAALDFETEERVIRNIHRRGCTIIMISHSLSTIKNCDEIYLLDGGKIVDKGTHRYLQEHSKMYSETVGVEGGLP